MWGCEWACFGKGSDKDNTPPTSQECAQCRGTTNGDAKCNRKRYPYKPCPDVLCDDRTNCGKGVQDSTGNVHLDQCNCNQITFDYSCPGDNPSVPADVCPPGQFQGVAHAIYRNNGDGTFTDVSAEAGLRQGPSECGMGLGVVVVDVNGDGKPDVYAVNDTTRNFLYLNQSSPGKIRLADVGLESGVALADRGRPDGSMGVDAADFDGTGKPSLWVTTFEQERHALYRNESTDKVVLFRYVTRETGIAGLGSGYVGFGTAFVDVDGDGWEDLVIANGHVRRQPWRSPVRQRPVLLRNRSSGQFANRTVQGGAYFQDVHRGRGLAVGDLDNDGRPDLVITHLNEPAAVLRNDPQGESPPRFHWIGLELLGKKNRDVAGARIVVDAGGRTLTRFVKGGGSYLSSGDRRVLVGLGNYDKADRVTVRWPWGEEQHWDGLAIDRYWKLAEGDSNAR